MANIVNSEEQRLLEDSLGISPASTVYLAIFEDSKSESELESGDVSGEITAYTGDRPSLSWGTGGQVNGAYTVETDADVEYDDMPSVTVGYIAIMDAASGGDALWWGQLDTNRSVESGDTLRFQSGEIDVSLD